MEFLFDYGLFLAKIATVVVSIIAILIVAKAVGSKSSSSKGELEVTNLTKQYKATIEELENYLFDDAELKARIKSDKKEKKEANKAKQKEVKEAVKAETLELTRDARLFVLDFKGSIDAKEVMSLREEVTAILAVAVQGDEVFLRLESGGGMVHGYGLASSQLDRLRDANIKLTVSVDKVAASGGYMMACIGEKIIAAPFAIVGSIGVVAQLPNFNKLLKKNDIEFEQLTAGEYKRTLTMFGENNDKDREKFQSELEETHVLFKDFIRQHRADLDLGKVATGEHWFGKQALELGLIDEIRTSDDYLMQACKDREVLSIHYVQKKKLGAKIAGVASQSAENLFMRLISKGQRPIV